MSFQIKDSNGQALGMNTLDAEAAKFWGKEPEKRMYANPFIPKEGMSQGEIFMGKTQGSWFDTIGYHIHKPESDWTSGWNNVKNSMFITCIQGEYKDLMKVNFNSFQSSGIYEEDSPEYKFLSSMYGIQTFLKPYFDLIDHWESKGYIPVQINE